MSSETIASTSSSPNQRKIPLTWKCLILVLLPGVTALLLSTFSSAIIQRRFQVFHLVGPSWVERVFWQLIPCMYSFDNFADVSMEKNLKGLNAERFRVPHYPTAKVNGRTGDRQLDLPFYDYLWIESYYQKENRRTLYELHRVIDDPEKSGVELRLISSEANTQTFVKPL